MLFWREEADWKFLVTKYFKNNHNFTILACFPNVVTPMSLETLSIKFLSFPFFLIFKVFVWCPKQNFKVSFSKIGVKTGVGKGKYSIQKVIGLLQECLPQMLTLVKKAQVFCLQQCESTQIHWGLWEEALVILDSCWLSAFVKRIEQVCYLAILWSKKEAKNYVVNPEDFLNVLHLESELDLVLKSSEQL